MKEHLIRALTQLHGRLSGPMNFRFVLQPSIAFIMALRAALRDAREGNPPFLWELITNPADRRKLLHSAWKDLTTVFTLACVLDIAYQIHVHKFVYPLQTIIVAILLAFVPYLIFRGPLTRLLRLIGVGKHDHGQ